MLAGSTSLSSPRGGTGLACLCGVLEKEKVPAVPSVANAWFMQRCHGVTCPRAGSSNPKFTRATNQPEKIPGRGFSPAVGLLVPVAPELSAGAAAVGRREATGHVFMLPPHASAALTRPPSSCCSWACGLL